MPRYRVTIFGPDYDAMADLVRKQKIDVLRQTVRRLDEGGYSVDAIVDEVQMRSLESRAIETEAGETSRAMETEAGETSRYTIERHEDVNEAGKARQEEVSKGDDYEEQLGPD
jgi:carboxypeptidase T